MPRAEKEIQLDARAEPEGQADDLSVGRPHAEAPSPSGRGPPARSGDRRPPGLVSPIGCTVIRHVAGAAGRVGVGDATDCREADPMSAEPKITSDFYDLEALLADEDRALLHRVRAFMDDRGPADHQRVLDPGGVPAPPHPRASPSSGIAGTPYSGYGCPGKSTLLDGMIAMELSRGDPSISTFMGVHGGLAMGSDLPLRLRGAEGALAAGDGADGADRRVRPHRARLRLRRRPRRCRPRPAGTATRGCWTARRSGSATPASPT